MNTTTSVPDGYDKTSEVPRQRTAVEVGLLGNGIRRPAGAIIDGFTIVDNRWLRSPHLSVREKGLLAYVLSHAEGFALTIDQIIREMSDGKDSITSTIQSLEHKGLMVRGERRRGNDGKLGAYDWHLVDPSSVDLAGRVASSAGRRVGSVVYYLRRGDGAIKIGFSAFLARRLDQLAEQHGELEMLATEPGGWREEQRRHDEFARLRIDPRREWFRPGAKLAAHIKALGGAR